jgi:intracellular sulfur oxidation DsrE/DsrF family protein
MFDQTTRPRFTRLAAIVATGATVALGVESTPAKAASKTHKISLQIDQNDPTVMNLALNNIANIATYYSGIADETQIELVAYGPGLHIFRADTSPVKDRLISIKQSLPDVIFSACNNTKVGMEKAEGHPIEIVPQARLVPAGVVRLVELQETGYAYIKV